MEPDPDSGGPTGSGEPIDYDAKMAREEARRNDPLRKEMLRKALEHIRNQSKASGQALDNGDSSENQPGSSTAPVDLTPDPANENEQITEEWPEEELANVDQEESEKFRKIENRFKKLKWPTPVERIEYEQAKAAEITRKKRRTKRKRLEAFSDDNDEELFVMEVPDAEQETLEDEQDQQDLQYQDREERNLLQALTQDEIPVAPEKPQRKTRAKRKRQNRIPAAEKRRGMQLGVARKVTVRKNKNSRKGRKRKANQVGSGSATELDDNGASGKRKPSKKRGRKDKESEKPTFDLDNLLAFNVVETAHTNASLPAIPSFTEKDKEKALLQLIASIPAADQAQAKTDMQTILEATRKFIPSARSDGQGGWKIKGMKTSLYHYQLLGAAFMRDREHSKQRPHGGMLCDVMGFGKTIQALTNIIDGKPVDPNDPVKTTLIVVPTHLVNHWRKQMRFHCEPSALGSVVEWHSRSRFKASDLLGLLQNQDIILTTYEEIRRSYPAFKPPTELTDASQIQKWWEDEYENGTGPLHKVRYHRIILDEGHLIKNPDSKVSRAVRALSGRYKWIVSGTPIHNYIEEFYPHFDFLDVPHTGRYDNFVNNFTKGAKAQNRLVNVLRSILNRRTHLSRLFGLPVLNLPDVDKLTDRVEFCDGEKLIYDAIFNAFMDNIACIPENLQLAKYRCFLTMILALRMFCSHLLVTQDIVKKLLTNDIMNQLRALSNKKPNPDHPTSQITRCLDGLRKNVAMPKPPQATQPEGLTQSESRESQPSPIPEGLQGDLVKLVQEFHTFMHELHEGGQWMERYERTNCPRCSMFPIQAVITSCKHMYCDECFCALTNETSEGEKPICQKCTTPIEAAAHCGSVDDIQIEIPPPEPTPRANKQRKKQSLPKSKYTQGRFGLFAAVRRRNSVKGGSLDDEDDGELKDWIPEAAMQMPGAKILAVRNHITKWIADNPEVKVVIFTQFLDFVRIISDMCRKEGWQSVSFTGKMPLSTREQNLDDFREKKDIRILISSLRAGGTGVDMSMANKCILVDLWWNEALQEQAVCRLFRIGQERDVEFVLLVIKDTIDDYMLDMQQEKTVEIENTMGEKVLKQRESIKDLIKMFGYGRKDHAFRVVHDGFEEDSYAETIDYDSEDDDYCAILGH